MKIIIQRFNEGESIANMVVEISRWSHAKLELNPKEQLNPIYHVSNLCNYTTFSSNYNIHKS